MMLRHRRLWPRLWLPIHRKRQHWDGRDINLTLHQDADNHEPTTKNSGTHMFFWRSLVILWSFTYPSPVPTLTQDQPLGGEKILHIWTRKRNALRIYLDLQINNRIAFIAPIKNALHVQSPFVFWSASLFGIRMPLRCQADTAISQCFRNHKGALCYTPLLALHTLERYCQK